MVGVSKAFIKYQFSAMLKILCAYLSEASNFKLNISRKACSNKDLKILQLKMQLINFLIKLKYILFLYNRGDDQDVAREAYDGSPRILCED